MKACEFDTDVILSTSVDISRNVRGFNFPSKMSSDEKENLIGMVRQAAGKSGMKFIRSSEMSDEVKSTLFKNQIIDLQFINKDAGKALLINDSGSLSIMMNQNDHIKIQSIADGYDVDSTYVEAEKLAVLFESGMDIAYSEKLGFLTSTPTDVGTGVKITFIAALPGIEKAGVMQKLVSRLEKSDWVIEPLLDEGRKHTSSYFYVSNANTLGLNEKELISRTKEVISDVIRLERTCRKAINKKNALYVEDHYYRAYGLMKYARKLEVPEVMETLSWVCIGQSAAENNDTEFTWDKINKIAMSTAFELVKSDGLINQRKKTISGSVSRAEMIREILEGDDNR